MASAPFKMASRYLFKFFFKMLKALYSLISNSSSSRWFKSPDLNRILLECGSAQSQDLADFILRNTQQADLVLEGFVESKESFYGSADGIYTLNYLNSKQVLKGESEEAGMIAVKTSEGSVGSTSQIFSHSPSLAKGESGLFFLTKGKDGSYRLLHGNEGKILLELPFLACLTRE